MADTDLQAESAAAKSRNPFELLNEFGCSQERVAAAMDELSEGIVTLTEKIPCGTATDHLYRYWLILEMIRHDQQRNVAMFLEAEQMLYAAGVQRTWEARS